MPFHQHKKSCSYQKLQLEFIYRCITSKLSALR
jgi:hypothetical protein